VVLTFQAFEMNTVVEGKYNLHQHRRLWLTYGAIVVVIVW